MKDASRILWRSEDFPKLILSERHLHLLRRAFPDINHFEPLLREAELWLFAHPERVPKKNWKNFINHWCKNSRRFRKAEYGESAARDDTNPQALGEILKKIGGNQ